MGVDGEPRLGTTLDKVGENIADAAHAFAGHVVVGVIFGGIPGGIFNVDMRDVRPDMRVEFPGILFAPGFGFGTIVVENWIGRIENEFEAGNFFEEFERERPAHTGVVHAIFVHGLNAVIEEEFCDFAKFAETIFGALIGIFARRDGVA